MVEGKEESQTLMNSVLPLAKQLLTEHGEFFPYGGAMKVDGKIISVAAYDGDENPPSTELMSILVKAFEGAARNKEYKATAMVYDVRVPMPETGKKSDAIAINLDHESGYSVVVFVPYSLNGGELVCGNIFAQAGSNDIFN